MTDKIDKMSKSTVMLLDFSSLQGMFEAHVDSKKLLDKFIELKGKGPIIVTTQAAFFRAIWLCKKEISVENIQKVLGIIVKVYPSKSSFLDEKEVIDEIIQYANYFSGGKKEN